MYTLESSIADLETQQTIDPDEEFLDDEEYPEAASSVEQPKPTLPTVYLTMPAGDFSGWGPKIVSSGSSFRMN